MDELTGEVIPGWQINVANPSDEPKLSGMALSDDGVLYVSNRDTAQILQYDIATGLPVGSGLFATLPDNPPFEPGGDPIAATPAAMRIDGEGNLFVSDTQGGRVLRYDLSAGPDPAPAAMPVGFTFGGGGIELVSGGTLLSSDFNPGLANSIYTGEGTPPTKLVDASTSQVLFGGVAAIRDLGDGTFVASDYFTNRVVRFSAAGQYLGEFQIQSPEGIDLSVPVHELPTGSIAASNYGSDVIVSPRGDLLLATAGVSSTYQGADKDYGELHRYDFNGNLLEVLAIDQSPMGPMLLAAGLVTLDGDYNRDGLVDSLDFDSWIDSYGASVTPLSGADGNGDGLVDSQDYAVWRTNLGVGVVAPLAAPEPASFLLIGAFVAILPHRRRR